MPKIRLLFLLIIIPLIVFACAPTEPIKPPIVEVTTIPPSASPTITQTSVPTETPTLTSTHTPTAPRLQGTPIPPSSPISASNITSFREMARWGAGVITDVDFSPDGKLIALSSSIGVYLYDVEDDTLDLWDLPVYLTSISFSRNGSMLVTGGRDSTVRVLNVENGEQIHLLKPTAHISSVQAVTFSQNGEHIASGYSDGRVRIWDVASGKQLRVIEANTDLIQSLSFSPDGTRLASGSRGTKLPALRVWDISTGQEAWHLKTDNSVKKIEFSQENNLLAYAVATMSNRSTGITVVDAQNGMIIKSLQGGNVVSFLEKGDLLAFSAGRYITMLDVQDWKKIHTLDHEYEITDIVISTDGKILASFSHWNGSLILWDVESGNQLKSVKFVSSHQIGVDENLNSV